MEETWKPIKGWESLYEVSDRGRVRSLPRVTESRNRWGPCLQHWPGQIMSTFDAGNGYLRVGMRQNGRIRYGSVHRLVAEAFIGPPPSPNHEVNHKDLNRANNVVENLEYVTHKENILHAIEIRGNWTPCGEKHGNAKLTNEQVNEIRRRKKEGERMTHLAREFGVHQSHVSRICSGKKRRVS